MIVSATRRGLSLAAVVLSAAGCASSMGSSNQPAPASATMVPDPRVGLKAGKMDAGEASWNLTLLSATPPSTKFVDGINSDLAFTGNYVIQGSFNGYQVWDISDPRHPTLATSYFCPASQSDVSTYKNLLFVSGEGHASRLDCGAEGVKDTASTQRLRGIRIFDISDLAHPKYIANVQTCRGSHTHSVLVDPNDPNDVYVYVSGSADVRSPSELAGCTDASPAKDPNTALFRIEVIKVPLAHPEQAAIVSSPRIFNDLVAPARHGESPEDIAAAAKEAAEARSHGAYTVTIMGMERIAPPDFVAPLLDSVMKARGGTGTPNGADSAALRSAFQGIVNKMFGLGDTTAGPKPGPTQCHDITLYPAIGLAGGACEGYGLLLDIHDPAHPVRLAAVSDSNFSYWHSATFNNDGTKILFSDEWGGGSQAKCRATDRREWGADALFNIVDGKPVFQGYYKLPAPQTKFENCVAHNGSMIPIPGRDVMAQSWYQGGVTVFDWTDAAHPKEIAFFDRGPLDSTRLDLGGTWSAYWYNGVIVSSEIVRGLDIFELAPSAYLSQNEIDAARTVHVDYQNTQGQAKFVWPPSFALVRAYVDQLERNGGLSREQVSTVRNELAEAEKADAPKRREELTELARKIDGYVGASSDSRKVSTLASAARDLAAK